MQTISIIVSILIYLFVLGGIFYLRNKGLLQVIGCLDNRPYSFSRVQATWWTIIIIGTFLYIFNLKAGEDVFLAPLQILNETALILLGISMGTAGIGAIIDNSKKNQDINRFQEDESEGFLMDIISDVNGVSVNRFQCLVFNLIFGLIFIYYVINNKVMPDFSEMELALLGISSATYIGLKATENNANNQSQDGARG